MYIALSSTWAVSCFRSAKSFAYSAIPSHYFNAYRVTSLVKHVLSSYAACREYACHYFVYFLFGRLSSPSRGIFNAQHVWSQPTIHHAKYLLVRVQKDKKKYKTTQSARHSLSQVPEPNSCYRKIQETLPEIHH